MKKKIIGLIMVVMVVVLFSTGCNGSGNATQVPDSEPIISSVDDPQPVVIEDSEVVSEIESESEEISEVEPEEVDPLAVLEVDMDYLQQYSCYGLKKGDKYYTLEEELREFDKKKYPGIGVRDDYEDCQYIYGNGDSEHKFSIGFLPVPILCREEGDLLTYCSGSTVPDLNLYKVSLHGYSMSMYINERLDTAKVYYTNDDGGYFESIYDIHDYGIKKADGSSVSDIYNLEQGQEYILYYYVGTQYSEIKMVADSCMYDGDFNKALYTIAPQFTQEGYVTFDLSGVEPGLYFINNAGLMEIQ